MTLAPWLQETWVNLQQRMQADRLPHAMLLATPRGMGKRGLAMALQASLLCSVRRADGHACGQCRACQWLASGTHADAQFISFELNDKGKPRTEITVDQIRALCEKFSQTSARGGWRVAVIDPADALNRNAANALLKTLEEPDPGVLMILVADALARLPQTLRSRCQRIDIPIPDRSVAVQWLTAQSISAADAEIALELADGNPGEAVLLAAPTARAALRALVDDLESLAAGAAVATLATRWAAADAEFQLRALARLITAAMRPDREQAGSEVRRVAQLLVAADFAAVSACWQQINRARSQLSSPLRVDLMMAEVLVDLRAAMR